MIYPHAAYKPVQNHGGFMSQQLGLVLHVQEGNNSLYGWFNNPTSQVSATWWISKTGMVEQYVDSGIVAWAQAAGNSTYCSVETEGFDTEALTTQQINELASLYLWGNQVYGWPFVNSEVPGNKGFAWHGMGGVPWGNHPGCPGDLRKNARQMILNIASGGTVTPGPVPNPIDPLVDPAVGMCVCPTGGYWIVTKLGGIYSFGCTFYGSAKGAPQVTAIVEMVSTPTGKGYYLCDASGGIFTFGDAVFQGSARA